MTWAQHTLAAAKPSPDLRPEFLVEFEYVHDVEVIRHVVRTWKLTISETVYRCIQYIYIYIHFHFWECSAVDRHGWQRDFCGRKTQRFYRVLHFCDRQITHYILSTDSAAFKCFTFASFSVSFHTVESVVRIKPIAPNTATFHISHTLAAVWDQQRQSDGLRCFCLEAQRSWIIHQKRMGQNWVSKKWDVERKWFGQALSGHTVPQVLAGGFRKKKHINTCSSITVGCNWSPKWLILPQCLKLATRLRCMTGIQQSVLPFLNQASAHWVGYWFGPQPFVPAMKPKHGCNQELPSGNLT